MIFPEHLRAAAGRFCSILRGFPAPRRAVGTAFYKSLRRRGKHIKLEEIASPGCYDKDSKTERHPPSCKTLTINQFIIKFQKKECIIMLFAIFAMALIFAEMYFTREATYTSLSDGPDYDYR